MNLFNYLESSYIEKNVVLQKEYTPKVKGETMAVQELIDLQRKFYRFVGFFTILGRYFGIKFGFITPLKTPEQIQADFKAEMQAKLDAEKAKAEADKPKLEVVPTQSTQVT